MQNISDLFSLHDMYKNLVSNEFVNETDLNLIIGQSAKETVYKNIVDMPHMIVSGEYEKFSINPVNTILTSLLLKNNPKDLKFYMLNFNNEIFKKNPYVLKMTSESDDSYKLLEHILDELYRRIELFAKVKVRNIDDYNRLSVTLQNYEMIPHVVVFINNYDDLVNSNVQFNKTLTNLVRLSKAFGVNIVLFTKNLRVLSKDILNNMKYKVLFKSTKEDSKFILGNENAMNLEENKVIIKDNDIVSNIEFVKVIDDDLKNVLKYALR